MSRSTWLCWHDTAHSPAFNMAMDEVLLNHAAEWDNQALLRIYDWDRPSVSCGSGQSYPVELTAQYSVVRRPTGGGVVYHDIDLTYTIVAPHGHELLNLDRMSSYRVFHEALLTELAQGGVETRLEGVPEVKAERATMRCFRSPSQFDLMARDGGKFAGAAQRRTRSGLLHQGSILLAAAHGDRALLTAELERGVARHFDVVWREWTPPESYWREAADLAAAKYESAAWNEQHLTPGEQAHSSIECTRS